ncbi:hypothetical protein FC72_GL000196 [Companilactobacillus tucceti DSM 20183]|uniref:Uncharacterized protein n=1 Tax=Companilactobacillus tucceti DSM 20183 TaxID=1423811 RepID=A0A0R1JF49_9LACO|nr:hypothetical protein FC72_GL000196 [Companilactobacillus tucceti DSM 20183]
MIAIIKQSEMSKAIGRLEFFASLFLDLGQNHFSSFEDNKLIQYASAAPIINGKEALYNTLKILNICAG